MPPQLKTVPLDAIKADDDFRYRCREDRKATITRLADDIQVNGLLSPLIVRESGKDLYQLVAGYRRYAALRELRKKGVKASQYIEAHVYPSGTNTMTLIGVRFSENLERKGFTPLDLAYAAEKLSYQDGLDNQEIRQVLRLSSDKKVQRLLRLIRAPKAVQEAVHDGWFPYSAALALMEAGDAAVMHQIFNEIEAAYDNQGLWSVRRIRKEVARRTRKRPPRVEKEHLKALRGLGLAVRRKGDGFSVSVELQQLSELAELLKSLSDKVAAL